MSFISPVGANGSRSLYNHSAFCEDHFGIYLVYAAHPLCSDGNSDMHSLRLQLLPRYSYKQYGVPVGTRMVTITTFTVTTTIISLV